ncbi:NAD-dependent epimerase/dehydratase family protein [Ectothiorhodospira variabilis]|uniref:NAD-dependent epimerase/dehydratase family protein n=1 Tax=Ectothiorhodospira variabilis TaxID=505694 RepID=UPI001EFB4A8D|nr:NAD(P)-dependent oxidoreductase [Ectothiorhodospira variabilis]MCG5497797.1 NAD(P)-dependent oxidoreductase [Ectothiorhodospira variabilis]
MKRVLITGASGFLGSHVADALSNAGHAVTLFDRRPSPHRRKDQLEIVGDVLDEEVLSEAMVGQDVVYHLAALADLNDAKSRPLDTVQLNVLGTVRVLEAARKAGVSRFLFSSTVYVYSREGSFYRCSKQACEGYIEEYQRHFGIDFTILRYGSLYGPRADESNGVYRLLQSAIKERRVSHPGGPGDQREYIHVLDAARLSVEALNMEFRNRHLVLTGAAGMRIGDLFTMFEEMLGAPLQVDYRNEKHGHYQITPYAYTPKVGYKLVANPHVDLGQGLLQVIEEIEAKGRYS